MSRPQQYQKNLRYMLMDTLCRRYGTEVVAQAMIDNPTLTVEEIMAKMVWDATINAQEEEVTL